MDKVAAMGWIRTFAGLAQCVSLNNYEAGFNPFEGARESVAVMNALTGQVIVAVRTEKAKGKTLVQAAKQEVWSVGIPTPVLGYPDTFGANKTVATTFLAERELEKLLVVWRAQAAPLESSADLKSLELPAVLSDRETDVPSPARQTFAGNPIEVLRAAAAGRLKHLYAGKCPDSVEGPDVRDDACVVCQALVALSQNTSEAP